MKKYPIIIFLFLLPSLVSAYTDPIVYSKDIGSGIILEQTDAKTLIKLKGKVLMSFSNESKEVPFIWDEGCVSYTEKLIKVSNNNGDQRQITWDNLGEKGQRQCMRERYQETIQTAKIAGTTRFMILRQGWYEGFNTTLIDLKNSTNQSIGENDILKVITGKNGVYVQTDTSRGDCHGDIYLINSSGKFMLQFSMCKLAKETDTAILNSFELLKNKQFQIVYTLNNKKITQIYTIKTK